MENYITGKTQWYLIPVCIVANISYRENVFSERSTGTGLLRNSFIFLYFLSNQAFNGIELSCSFASFRELGTLYSLECRSNYQYMTIPKSHQCHVSGSYLDRDSIHPQHGLTSRLPYKQDLLTIPLWRDIQDHMEPVGAPSGMSIHALLDHSHSSRSISHTHHILYRMSDLHINACDLWRSYSKQINIETSLIWTPPQGPQVD